MWEDTKELCSRSQEDARPQGWCLGSSRHALVRSHIEQGELCPWEEKAICSLLVREDTVFSTQNATSLAHLCVAAAVVVLKQHNKGLLISLDQWIASHTQDQSFSGRTEASAYLWAIYCPLPALDVKVLILCPKVGSAGPCQLYPNIYFERFIFFNCISFYLNVCMCTMCCWNPKRWFEPLELEL